MRTTALTVTEVVRHFSEYINRIAYKHERFILLKGKKAIAELKPLPSGRLLGDLPDLLAALPALSKEDAAAFSDDISNLRKSVSDETLRDPWAS